MLTLVGTIVNYDIRLDPSAEVSGAWNLYRWWQNVVGCSAAKKASTVFATGTGVLAG